MQGLAAGAEAQGEPHRAARLLGAAEALLEAAEFILYAQVNDEPRSPRMRCHRALVGDICPLLSAPYRSRCGKFKCRAAVARRSQ